jgi:hypothetical protein
VVKYDDNLYPGVILDVAEDNTAEVKCMHKVGTNRFYWPQIDDVLWYSVVLYWQSLIRRQLYFRSHIIFYSDSSYSL